MRVGLATVLAACGAVAVAHAQPPKPAQPLKPALADVAFLVGDWSSGEGAVAETGGRSRGSSRITAEAGGAVLLRRDHTELSDGAGRPARTFDQIMMIWPEAGTLRADYSDGTHLIHYTGAEVSPGRSVAFSSAQAPGAPVFRLTYTLSAPDALAVAFAMAPPGGGAFQPIATGVLHRSP